MGGSNKRKIQILKAEKRDDHYFSIIKLVRNDLDRTLQFGISENDYYCIKKITSFRPFEDSPVSSYRYFFEGSYSKNHPSVGLTTATFRIEQRKIGKNYRFPISTLFIANLLWFEMITDESVLKPFTVPTENDI